MADNKEEAQRFLERKKAEAKEERDKQNEKAKKVGRTGLDKQSFDGGKDTSARKGSWDRFRK